MKKILLILLASLITACGVKKGDDKPATLSIVVSIFPLYDAVKNIAGDSAEVINAVPAGSDPHAFEPAPSTVRKISSAGLCVLVADEFDGWIKKSAGPTARIIVLADDPALMKDHNPHFWVSPELMITALEKTVTAMSEIDPDNAPAYMKRFRIYSEKLTSLDKKIADRLKDLKGASFIQWHAAWNAYADRYGLKIPATVEGGHGKAPSLRELSRIISLAKSSGIKVLVSDPRAPEGPAASFVKETGAALVLLDPLGGASENSNTTYIDTMSANTELLAGALEKR